MTKTTLKQAHLEKAIMDKVKATPGCEMIANVSIAPDDSPYRLSNWKFGSWIRLGQKTAPAVAHQVIADMQDLYKCDFD